MPTIRRPSWRARKIHGYDVESFKTHDNRELEVDYQFRNSNLTDEARAMFLRMRLNIWFIRRPGWKTTFATLIHIDGHHAETYEILKSLGGDIPAVWISEIHRERVRGREVIMDHPRGEGFGALACGNYHYSFVAGKVKSYMNGNPEWLWDAVKEEFRWDGVSSEDKAALRAVADELAADF